MVIESEANLKSCIENNNEEGLPERIERYKDKILNAPFQTDIERLVWYTRVYKSTEGQSIGPNTRTAQAFRETLRNMVIRIDEDELLVGNWTGKVGAVPLGIEIIGPVYRELLMPLKFRDNPEKIKELFPDGSGSLSPKALIQLATSLSDEEFKILTTEIIHYWEENSVAGLIKKKFAEEGLLGETFSKGYSFFFPTPHDLDVLTAVTPQQGHITIGIEKVLKLGFKGIAVQAEKELSEIKESIPEDSEIFRKSKDFLEAVIISAEAVNGFAERFEKLAKELAAKEKDLRRKQELLEIAERCEHVPKDPPRTFLEALQAVWFTQVVIAIGYGGEMIIAPGRVDQYLYPFYKKDVENGNITREKALVLLMEYLLKTVQDIYFGPNDITIGGTDKNGNSAVNDVSHLFLESLKKLKGAGRAGLAVRISPDTPREFLLEAAEVYRKTGGVAFYNDPVISRDLMTDGYSLKDARDYSIVGCVEPTGTGNNNGYTSGQAIRLPSVLETSLYGGKLSILNWKQIGAKTPTTFTKFDDLLNAFKEQIEYAVDLCVRKSYMKDMIIAENYPIPILSATIEGCIENARDITNGGAQYNHSNVSAQSIASIANSLAAIKWAVFDKKIIAMEELLNVLKNNFKDAEEIRQILLGAPKYGNDDPYVDEIALWVAKVLEESARNKRSWTGGPHRTCLISISGTQIFEGQLIGATPDGRLAHTPVSVSTNPVDGTAKEGLTATLKSAAHLSKAGQSDGTSLTLNLNPTMIKNEEGLEKFVSLLEGAFELNVRMVQFNPLNKDILLDAQKHPEKYSDLVVKVSGYSFRFIDLPKVLQNEIIARFEYGN